MQIELFDHTLYHGASCTVTIEVGDVEMMLTDEGIHVYSQRFNSGTVDKPIFEAIPYAKLAPELQEFGTILSEAYEELHAAEPYDDDGEEVEDVIEQHDTATSSAENQIQEMLDDPKVQAWLMELAL
jgi:hypothetical protein